MQAETPGEDLGMVATPPPSETERTIVLVAGPDSRGTVLMSGILEQAGLHVPGPLAPTTGQPQWIVDFHDDLLKKAVVDPGDGRPNAWFEASTTGSLDKSRSTLVTWLSEHFEEYDALLVAEPRLAWFLGLWSVAALRTNATTATVVMLSPPPDVVRDAGDTDRLGDISRLAGWVNHSLFTERATRRGRRSFVRYHDLVDDWTRTLVRVGVDLELEQISQLGIRPMAQIHRLVDPEQRGPRTTWDDLAVPAQLREIAQAAMEELDPLADPDGDSPGRRRRLDQIRHAYSALYAEAEALAASSVRAAGPEFARAQRKARREARREAERTRAEREERAAGRAAKTTEVTQTAPAASTGQSAAKPAAPQADPIPPAAAKARRFDGRLNRRPADG